MSREETDRNLDALKRRIELLEAELRRIKQREAESGQLDRPKPTYYITIEHLQMERPVLEQLAFQLDSLDIKELSGSLNLGNNFGSPAAIKAAVRETDGQPKKAAQREPAREGSSCEGAAQKEPAREGSSSGEAAQKKSPREGSSSEEAAQKKSPRQVSAWEESVNVRAADSPGGFAEPVRAAVWHKPVLGHPNNLAPKEPGAAGNGPRITLNSHRGE